MAPIGMHDIQDLVLIVSPPLLLAHFSQNVNNMKWETISVLPPRAHASLSLTNQKHLFPFVQLLMCPQYNDT